MAGKFPKLTPAQMAAAMKKLAALPLDDETKARIALMLLEGSSTSEAEHADARRIDEGRAADQQQTAAVLTAHFSGIMSRAAQGLAAMSDEEWGALVDEANADEQE